MNKLALLMVVACWPLTLAMAADPTTDATTADEADATAADLKAMQGRWVREFTNRNGAVLHAEKLVTDCHGIVTETDPSGNVIHSHNGDFKLQREAGVRLVKFQNATVTAGPDTGARQQGTSSFLYRLDGDTMYEVWGLCDGDATLPTIIVWRRAK